MSEIILENNPYYEEVKTPFGTVIISIDEVEGKVTLFFSSSVDSPTKNTFDDTTVTLKSPNIKNVRIEDLVDVVNISIHDPVNSINVIKAKISGQLRTRNSLVKMEQ